MAEPELAKPKEIFILGLTQAGRQFRLFNLNSLNCLPFAVGRGEGAGGR